MKAEADVVNTLAESAGAKLSAPLAPNEIVSFRLRLDGGVTVVLASGEVVRTANSADVPPTVRAEHQSKVIELKDLMRRLSGGVLVPGRTYIRRQIETAPGQFSGIFAEAGR